MHKNRLPPLRVLLLSYHIVLAKSQANKCGAYLAGCFPCYNQVTTPPKGTRRTAMANKLGHVILLSNQPATDAEWLTAVLDWPVISTQLAKQYVELQTDTNRLALVHPQAMAPFCGQTLSPLSPDAPTPPVVLSIEVPELAPVLALALAHNASLSAPATQQPWGLWTAFIRTPFGLILELCSPVA
jgi:hypothetical protein